jgi:hypothetical protein
LFVRAERFDRSGLTERTRSRKSRDWIATVATGSATTLGIIYVLGGVALYLQLDRAGIPPGEGVDAFSSRRFIVVGVIAAVCATLIGAAVGVAAHLLLRRSRRRPVIAAAAALVGVALGMYVFTYWLRPLTLREATVVTRHGECLQGPFVSSDAQGVHLGAEGELLTIRSDVVKTVTLRERVKASEQHIKRCN